MLKWGVERRLEFIEFRLFWEGGVNRSDLIDTFGVSVPQASKDLTHYQERAPQCQRRRKTRPLGGAKPGQYSRHAGKRREGVARAVLACVRGDFRRTVQADWPDFRALLWARR